MKKALKLVKHRQRNHNIVRRDLTGVYGDLSGVCGNLDDCELTNAERRNGVDIADLLGAAVYNPVAAHPLEHR